VVAQTLCVRRTRENVDGVPAVQAGRRLIVAAHGNTLRALVKCLEKISDTEIPQLEIPTGSPLVYELDERSEPTTRAIISETARLQWKLSKPLIISFRSAPRLVKKVSINFCAFEITRASGCFFLRLGVHWVGWSIRVFACSANHGLFSRSPCPISMAEAKERPGNREVTGVFMRPLAREIFFLTWQ
jgi:hypothetical protein